MKSLKIELQIIEGANRVVVVCAETGRIIGTQSSTVIESQSEGFTVATVTFQIPPMKVTK